MSASVSSICAVGIASAAFLGSGVASAASISSAHEQLTGCGTVRATILRTGEVRAVVSDQDPCGAFSSAPVQYSWAVAHPWGRGWTRTGPATPEDRRTRWAQDASALATSDSAGEVVASVAGPGEALPPPTVLGRGDGGPGAVVASGGRALVVWGSAGGLVASTHGPGGWWEPMSIAAPGARISLIDLQVNDSGDALVAWRRYEQPTQVPIYAAYRPASGAWSTSRIERHPGGWPLIALGPVGDATIAWSQRTGGGRLRVASRSRNGRWRTARPPTTATGSEISGLAMDAAGTTYLAWSDARGRARIRARARGGGWGRVRSIPVSSDLALRIAIGSFGDIVATRDDPGAQRIVAGRPGGPWAIRRGALGLGSSGSPQVNAAGDGVVLWEGEQGHSSQQAGAWLIRGQGRPAVRALALAGASKARRFRLVLSAKGRALLTLRRAGDGVAVAAGFVAAGTRPRWRALPPGLAAAARRPGAYTLTADTGGRDVPASTREVPVE